MASPAPATAAGLDATPRIPASGLVLAGCLLFWICLLLVGPARENPTLALGRDLPLAMYEDKAGTLELPDFLALPADALTRLDRPLSKGYTRSAFWLRTAVPAEAFAQGELWLKLSPNYVDQITVYLRAGGAALPWTRRDAGDRAGAGVGDVDYRFTILKLPPPAAGHPFELVMRVQSTSAVIVEPTLWTPAAFVSHAGRDTAFWSLYFGIGALSSALALLLAIGLRTRLLWSVMPFSLSFLLVACIQGYVGWGASEWRMTLQHYLISILSLLGYPALLWMCIEALDLRRHFPRVYQGLLGSFAIGMLLPASIPLNLYGHAVIVMVTLGLANAVVLAALATRLWRRGVLRPLNLVFGVLPLFYVGAGLVAILITTATIRYHPAVYTIWQYSMMAIMMTTMLLVMSLGVHRIRNERQTEKERARLATDLHRERENSFHQRQFLGMISHEFRTPLAVISGAVQNLHAIAPADARIRQRYDKIQRAAHRLEQLTDNCLADARLSADQLYLAPQPVHLHDLVCEAATLLEASEQDRFHLEVTAAARTRADAQADPAMLRIALSNVLDNAAKHASNGEISVQVDLVGPLWVIRVDDQGPGIPPALVDQVFERFRQGVAPGDAGRRGYGLGLFVARQIARAHGGDLVLAANTPQGCRFEFHLPVAPRFRSPAHD